MTRSIRAFFLIASVLGSYALQWLLVKAARRAFSQRWQRVHERNARRLQRGFTELRGVFIKLGQVLSVLGGFLPGEYRRALETLQDQVPARPFDEVTGRLEEAFGEGALQRYASFERAPIAAASLAQVHKATLADGREVAVKVLYPGIERLIGRDLFVLRLFLPVINRVLPIVRFDRVLSQLAAMLRRETDYENERRNMQRLRDIFAGKPDVVVPTVVPELSRAGVLTMSFEAGAHISEVLREPTPDPHPGNFLVRPGPCLVILDYGAVEDVSEPLVRGLRTVILGALTRNADQVLEGAEQMGFVAPDGDRELLREVGREYLKTLATLRVTDFSSFDREQMQKLAGYSLLRGRLREVMRSVEYPEGYFYLERTLALLFGIVGQLEPTRGLPGVAAPIASKLMLRSLARPVAQG
jgi:ubiquinone biosynthesis protein